MSLKSWSDAGWIREQEPDPEMIRVALDAARKDLQQCQVEGLSPEWRLIIGYTCILNAAMAALLASGYRADRDQHHYRTLQSLQLTVGMPPNEVRRLDRYRKKRHISTYERVEAVSELEADEIAEAAAGVLVTVTKWLSERQPNLVEED